MPLNVRKIFRSYCGPDAEYVGSEYNQRGEYNTIEIVFRVYPEKRVFRLDGVLHGPTDEDTTQAVVRIAEIAKNIKQHLEV